MFFLFIYLGVINIQAQNMIITGVISDTRSGLPIPGATVIVQGTSTGAVTNFDGKYSINAEIGDILLFSYLGMEEKAVTVTKTTMNVALNESVEDLDEVVVIGYGTVTKKELTGAVGSIKARDIENIVTSDVGNALQGQVAGVNIISSAVPGGQSEILIRGIATINGESTPLYVVDGIPQEGDPGIAPSDIESIDILKDAASAAIYGSRGATGVILITTKKGEAGTLAVRLNASYGLKDITSGTPLMNREEQTYFDLVTNRNTIGVTDDVSVLGLSRNVGGFQNNTDLSELVFIDNAAFQNYEINISGGSDDIRYNVSTSLFNEEGIVINSDFRRFNTRANTTYSKGKWNISGIVGLTKEKTSRSPGGIITQTIRYLPTQQGLNLDSDDPLLSLGGDESNRLGWVIDSFDNTDIQNITKAFATFNVNYEIFKGLNVWSRVGINEVNGYRDRFNGYTPVFNSLTGELLSNPSNSFADSAAFRRSSLAWETIATFKKQIDDHSLTFTGGYTREKYEGQDFSARKFGVVNNNIRVLNGATINPDARSGTYYTTTLIGILGRLQYNYKGKYFLSSSIRRDASSVFGEKNKWGIFPSISFAWNVSEEKFWKPIKSVVSNFKLRANRGTLGNNRIPNYSFSTGITSGIDYAFGVGDGILALGSAQNQFANADVKWETKKETNFGLDLGLFKNKVTFSAEVYDISNEDMLFPVLVPGSNGGGNNSIVRLNVGNMTNKGVELSFGYKDQIGKLNFRMNGTFTTNENEITNMNGADFRLTNDFGIIDGARSSSQVTALALGHEAGAFFLYQTNGIADTPEKLAEYQQIDPNAELGDLIYVDADNSGDLSDADRQYSGSGLPEFEVGYNLSIDYKGFDLSTQWYAAIGHEIMNGAKANAYGWGRHKDLVYAYSDANTTTTIPAYRGNVKNHANFKGFTDLFLENGDYLRLKNITLGYSLPKKSIEKLGITKLRLYVTGQNLLTITDYEGYDPEVGGGISARGLDKGNYPVTSQFIFGLNLNF